MNPLALLEDPLRGLLDFLHENANLTYGWSIVVLTLIVRSALLPLVIKQYSSMRSMQMVAPQLKELQAKYKGNRQKLNEELMAFYKENQINPFASCLPLVAQLPIFIALYYVLRDFSNDGGRHRADLSFMWLIPDVAADFTLQRRQPRAGDRSTACRSSCRPSSRRRRTCPSRSGGSCGSSRSSS